MWIEFNSLLALGKSERESDIVGKQVLLQLEQYIGIERSGNQNQQLWQSAFDEPSVWTNP